MLSASLVFAALAALAAAVVYGTDVFAALVLRPAFAALDDGVLTQAAGRIHQYADQRMPLPGAASVLAAAASTLAAGIAGHALQAAVTGAALIALLVWLALYIRIAAPINRALTHAAAAHEHQRTRARCSRDGTASSVFGSPCRPPLSPFLYACSQ